MSDSVYPVAGGMSGMSGMSGMNVALYISQYLLPFGIGESDKTVNQANKGHVCCQGVADGRLAAFRIPAVSTFGREPHTGNMLMSCVYLQTGRGDLKNFSASVSIQYWWSVGLIVLPENSGKCLTAVAVTDQPVTAVL